MKLLDTAMAILVSLSGTSDLEIQRKIDPQRFCMAQNIYFESRNESTAGKVAVLNVTMNRVNSDDFPNTICEVVYEGPHYQSVVDPELWYPYKNRCQFSWYCDGIGDVVRPSENWYKSQIVALQLLDGKYRGIIEGATHYHATWVSPVWRHELTYIGQVGDHLFYRWEN